MKLPWIPLVACLSIAGIVYVTLAVKKPVDQVVVDPVIDVTPVSFENKTEQAGLNVYSPTFGIAVADVDNDGADDLLVGHHGFPPALYLNRKGTFVADTNALPAELKKRADRHGYTVVDFDNDGDKDFAYAGGGAAGIGVGQANAVYKNLLIETNNLEFVDVSSASDIGDVSGRTRELLPLANPAGDKVDLYSTGLHKPRVGSKNLYAVNLSTPGNIEFKMDPQSSLALPLESDGKDLFFDFDRDGLADFLSVGQGQALLSRNNAGQYARLPTELDDVWGIISAAVADLNNDGFPDLYLGRGNRATNSDQVTSNSREIHFIVQHQGDDTGESITFRTKALGLTLNFLEYIPSLDQRRTDATDIFIGENMTNPKFRQAETGKKRAAGKPANTDHPGIYIWYEKQDDLWHVLWRHDKKNSPGSRGIIKSEGIELVASEQFEKFPERETQDLIAINARGKDWKLIKLDALKHSQWTNDVTAADFNNDGLVDIVGVQTAEEGAENGNPFIVLNHGGLTFSRQEILQNEEDDIFRADLIVHGFFNDDGLPDVFYTNGFGLLPSHVGPYQFWLNSTVTSNGYVLLELEGTTANRDAIGAQIELYDADKKLLGYRELGSNFSRGQNTHKIHFGLGGREGPFLARIRWPGSGQWQEVPINKNSVNHIRQDAP